MQDRTNGLDVYMQLNHRGAGKGNVELRSAHQYIFYFGSKDARILSHFPVKDGGRAMMCVHACVAYEFAYIPEGLSGFGCEF